MEKITMESRANGKSTPQIGMDRPAQTNQQMSNNPSEDDTARTIREQDLFLPQASVVRIMRKVLPSRAKIAEESKVAMQECISEFISFITSEANDHCKEEQRRTLTATDLLWAMNKLGFNDYIEPLGMYLDRYREYEDRENGVTRVESSKVTADDPANSSFAAFPPAFVDQYPGFFGVAPATATGPAQMNRFPNVPSGAGPSQAAEANYDPLAQSHKKRRA